MGQFFKQFFTSCLGTLAGLILFVSLGTGGLFVLLLASLGQNNNVAVKDKSILVFDLSTTITDTNSQSTLSQSLQENGQRLTLRQVIQAIETATEDDKIVGLFLYGRSTTGSYGYATLAEIREVLKKFQQAGKKIIAYDGDWSEKEYYLGSMANKVIINPMGTIEINGLSSEQLFLAGALEKYGIGVQVIRVGSYKAAAEPYIRKNLSPENRQQIQVLLDNIWTNFLGVVAANRKVTPQALQKIVDSKGILGANEAQQVRLVDQVAYLDEVITELKQLTGQKDEENIQTNQSFRQVSLETYADVEPIASSKNQIAILYAEGTIVDGQGDTGEIGGDYYAKEIRKLRRDPDIKAVVLRVNSPGGSATASETILREIKLLSKEKPVIVSMGDVAASGGYWISMGAKRIFAEKNTLTGSIGVFGLLFNVEKIANNNGLAWDGVKTGKFADIDSTSRPKTEQELKIYQVFVNQIYDLFLDKVSQSRKLPKEKVQAIAQGRVWSGEAAKKNGLVDEIGGLEKSVEYAAKEAKLGEDWSIREYPTRSSFEEELLEKLFKSQLLAQAQQNHPLTAQWNQLKEEWTGLQHFNDPQGVYSSLLFKWKID